jgi:GT2 family glycosyltransferase/glycosyltransferase involved in cell wall biosynthesis
MLPPNSLNPKGYWEYRPFVDINDQVLQRLGGSWHEPPTWPPEWESSAELADLRRQARTLIEQDFATECWGWKDPRTCLTLPFWRRVLPPQRYVICLRNPADVAKSLACRDNFPFAKSFQLWHCYTTSALEHSADQPALMLFYEDFLQEPAQEVSRLANFLGRSEVDQIVFRDVIEAEFRHHRTSVLNAVDEPDFAFPAKALYVALRLFANESKQNSHPAGVLSAQAQQFWRLFSNCSYKAHLDGQQIMREKERCAREAQETLNNQTEQIRQQATRLEQQRLQLDEQARRVAELSATVSVREREANALRQELAARTTMQEQIDQLRAAASALVGTARKRGGVRLQRSHYDRLICQVREIVLAKTPRASTLAVVSKGDNDLLNFDGRVAWHFPQISGGVYAGHHPADSDAAIKHLEALTSRGAKFLIFPETAFWWLDYYDGFRRHLDRRYRRIHDGKPCIIYDLSESSWLRRWFDRARHLLMNWTSPPRTGNLGASDEKQEEGLRETKERCKKVIDPVAAILAQRTLDPYEAWLEVNRWTPRRAADLRARLAALGTLPLISIAMPVYNPPPQFLDRAIQSVYDQVHENWELCIANDASTDPEVQRILKDWADRDPRIKVCARKENGNISRATNSAAELAKGDFLVFLDHDDELEPDALGEVALYLSAHPETDIVYTDDDKIDEKGRRFDPQFKPDWSPELLLSYMYLCHLFAIRRSLFSRVGGLRVGFEGSQDYDLALRATEHTDRVGHIPKVLYHWRAIPGSTASSGAEKPHSFQAGLRAVQEALDRRGIPARALQPSWAVAAKCGIFSHSFPDEGPRVAILIPTKDNHPTLQVCLESIKKTTYTNYEVVIIDNESENPQTLEYLRTLPHRLLRIPSPAGKFNYAAIINQAVSQADAELILFLNDDTEVIDPCWLSQMVGYLRVPGVGAVGARLLYPNGDIQHAGVVHGYFNGLAGHAFKNKSPHDNGYLSYARVLRNCSAVTAACMLTRRDTFLSVGGFDEKAFAVAYNDVDFCHRLVQHGLRVVYCPTAELIHHEGNSRGFIDAPIEPSNYLKKYRHRIDRYYNPNLSFDDEWFRIASRTCEPGRQAPIPALMCTHNLNWEGAPYQQYELAVWLKKRGIIEPVVYSPSDGPLRQEYEKQGIPVQIFGHPLMGVHTIQAYDDAMARFSHFLRKNQFEMVHANTLETFYAIEAAHLAGLSSVWNVHESEPWQNYFDRFGPEIAFRALRCFNYPYKVVFVANATRAGCLALNKRQNFTTIHNGLDLKRIKEAGHSREAARRRLAVGEDDFVVLLLGTVCERKGQIDLVEAVGHLEVDLVRGMQCFIVGDRPGSYSERLWAKHQALDEIRRSRVHIIPETSESFLYYSAADVFVCSSRMESFPRVILEAMACRLPIITTPVFGIVEQVREHVNALFYQPGDISALASALRRLLQDLDLRMRMAENSVPVLERINDYETMGSAYARLFREAWMSGEPRHSTEK